MSQKCDKNVSKINDNIRSNDTKTTKTTKCVSNAIKTIENNSDIDLNTNKTNDNQRQHNYNHNSNRFNYNDRNRRPEKYSRYQYKPSDYGRDLYRRRCDSNGLNVRSNDCKSDKSDHKIIAESNDGKCGESADKSSSDDSNLQLKLDEITALKSIFDQNVLTVDENGLKGRFLAEPMISSNEFIVFYDTNEDNRHANSHRYCRPEISHRRDNESNCHKSDSKKEFSVKYLPPIELYFELPLKYPSECSPMFLISSKWLNIFELEKICSKLENLWNESKMEVLFIWFSFLQNEVLEYLKIGHKLDISSLIRQKPKWVSKCDPNSSESLSSKTLHKTLDAKRSHSRSNGYNGKTVLKLNPCLYRGNGRFDRRATCDVIGHELISHLKSYNEFKRKETFNKSYITCNVCLSPHLGEECVVFPCNHINCKTCVRDYFTTLVMEGAVNQVKCLENECQTSAPPNLVRELISEELFEKYDRLLLDSVVGSMSDAYYCPRKTCGRLVIADTDSTLAHCSSCGYAFCKNCKFSYHGFDPCNMFRDAQQRKAILERYTNGNSKERQELEKLYGKKQLSAALEDEATDKWLEDMAKRCPHCKASIEKSDGCNKMACFKCNTFFCWICLSQLPISQPYSHFNDPNSKCFNQLFRGVNLEMEDVWEDIVY